jgi:hypothetical protein
VAVGDGVGVGDSTTATVGVAVGVATDQKYASALVAANARKSAAQTGLIAEPVTEKPRAYFLTFFNACSTPAIRFGSPFPSILAFM